MFDRTTAALLLLLAGCEGTMTTTTTPAGPTGATFEVESLAPRCAEAACTLDRPILRGATMDVTVEITDAATDAAFDLEATSSDGSILAIERSVAEGDPASTTTRAYRITLRALASGSATLQLRRPGGRALASAAVQVADAVGIDVMIGGNAPPGDDGTPELLAGETVHAAAEGRAADGGLLYLGDALTWSITPACAALTGDDGDSLTTTGETTYVLGLTPGSALLTAAAGTISTPTALTIAAP